MFRGISINRQHWLWWSVLLVIGIFAFGVRYYYIIHAQVLQPRGDAIAYVAYARNLAQHGVFSMAAQGASSVVGDSFRDPGYPVFLAFWMKLFNQWDPWYAAVLLSQAVLSALTVVATLGLARRWMSMRWLVAAGVLMAVWPHSVSMSGYLLSETLFGFLCASGLLLLSEALTRRSACLAVASGLVLALAALTNAVVLPFAFLAAVYLLIRRQLTKAMFAGLVLGALALLAPWSMRNAMLPSTDSSSTNRALINLVQGSWPQTHAAYQAKVNHRNDAAELQAPIDEEIALVEADPMAGISHMARRMAGHPSTYLRWYVSKPLLLWDWSIRVGQGDIYVFPTRNSPFETNLAYRIVAAVCRAMNVWLFVFMIAGCLLAWRRRNQTQPERAATALMLILVTLVYSLLQAEPRYSVAFRGLEIAMAASAACQLLQWVARARTIAKGRAEAC